MCVCVCVCACACSTTYVSAWLNVKLCVHVGTVVQSHCDSVTGQNVHTVVTSFNPCTLYIVFRQKRLLEGTECSYGDCREEVLTSTSCTAHWLGHHL